MKIVAPEPTPVPAVRPNAGIEVWYRRKLLALVERMHDSLDLHMRAAWKSAQPAVGVAQDDSAVVELKRALSKWGRRWIGTMNEMADEIAEAFATRSFRYAENAMRDAFKRTGFTVKFRPTPGSVEAYRAVIAENVNLIRSIPQQYLKDVQSGVWQSVMQGGDEDTLSRSLRKSYGVTYRRAALISRDQNAKAKAVIEKQRRLELGLTEAIWMHSHAGKVPRPTHVAMHGRRFKIADGFYDSDEGRKVQPGELINCRCSSKAIVPGFGG